MTFFFPLMSRMDRSKRPSHEKIKIMEPKDDAYWMDRAADLSRMGMENNLGGPFGAVIVRGDDLVGMGQNQVTSSLDPSAHAEVVAIRDACRKLQTFSLRGCRIYSSCEPCPMCLGAVYWARLDALFFGNTREHAAEIGFDDDFLYREIPLPLTQRNKPTIHLACQAARSVFEAWQKKADKIAY